MKTQTLPRVRTAERRKYDSGFSLRAILFIPVTILSYLVMWLMPSKEVVRTRFDGYTSGNDGDLKPLDSLTKAEREEIGAAWAVDMRGDE